ncbi:uncharacterized protein PG986_003119 [Apiospora aurea]|uniref:Uncharacterized protein n=1 Tax=Apiospora aurea TaxID=335848 RepID=A0ABR1QRB8_9PEZI
MTTTTATTTRPDPLVIFPSELLSTPTAAKPTSELLTRIAQEKVYSFYGPFEAATLSTSVAACITSNSDGSAARLTAVLRRFLDHAQQDCLAGAASPDKPLTTQACWLVARMFEPSEEYVVPRWHRDGRMFTCSCSGSVETEEGGESSGRAEQPLPHSKYAVTLLGPATRVLAPGQPAVDAALADVKSRMGLDEPQGRAELAEALGGCEECEVERGQVIRFSWGQDDSPVHSEPDFAGEDRVFVSVLFGSETEIRDMCRRRRETFGVVGVRS